MDKIQPSLADIYLARSQIKNFAVKTELVFSSALSRQLESNVYLKLESHQVTGSFKIRGAANKISTLSEEERRRGVIAVSSGNHGKAVAYVSSRLGVRALICIPATVPPNKVEAIREFGGDVHISGQTYDEATLYAERVRDEQGMTMVHPFDDPRVIAGQGTIGLELLDELPQIDMVVVPLSGGGLLGGIALTLKTIKPSVYSVGVTMNQGAAMHESLITGKVVDIVEKPTLADALAGGLGSNNYTFELCRRYVDETVLVSEQEIATAMLFALEKHQLVVEGGGAVGIAALLHNKINKKGKNIVLIISGGNVGISTLAKVIQHRDG